MATLSAPYPVTVRGRLDPKLGRWRWLVKWFLAIPHLLVLVLLWCAFALLTIVAGVNIAFTGRYPKCIFDFNVGVMRWSWRVQFYAITLGTDRYPPFSLQADPEYPANLDVEYPERLSRGLVWVKWWLLAIPHYLVISVFAGGFVAGVRFGGGLITILAIIAAVALAVTRRYPESIFGLLMGMHRWCWRVTAYAALMRDEYPPFQLDCDPDEPPPTSKAPPADPLAA